MKRHRLIAAAAVAVSALLVVGGASVVTSNAEAPAAAPTTQCVKPTDNITHRKIVNYVACRSDELLALHDQAAPAPTVTETVTETVSPEPSETASPSPTATSTPTAPAGDNVCTDPDWTTVSTDNMGEGRTYGDYYVHNNMWNNSSGTYSMGVCSADSWYVVADQPHPSDNGVQAYPNVHKDYADQPLSTIESARFAATPPRCEGCIYNVAFDVWINQDFENELMIWTENSGQRPAGTRLTDTTIGGHEYQVWKSGGATSQGGIFTYVSKTAQTSGTMPLALFFDDLEARGWIPPNSTTWQVDFGVEVVSTEGNPERFDFTDFAITERTS